MQFPISWLLKKKYLKSSESQSLGHYSRIWDFFVVVFGNRIMTLSKAVLHVSMMIAWLGVFLTRCYIRRQQKLNFLVRFAYALKSQYFRKIWLISMCRKSWFTPIQVHSFPVCLELKIFFSLTIWRKQQLAAQNPKSIYEFISNYTSAYAFWTMSNIQSEVIFSHTLFFVQLSFTEIIMCVSFQTGLKGKKIRNICDIFA